MKFGGIKAFSPLQWLNFAAAVVTIAGGLTMLLQAVNSGTGVVLALFFCTLFSLSWMLLILQEYRYSRKAKYAEAQDHVHRCFHLVRDAWYSWSVESSENASREQIKAALKEFASAFSLITGTNCRACIKVTYVVDDRAHPKRSMAVKTYARSDDAEEQTHESGHDWVDDNSDFEELMKADKEPAIRRFLRNDLPYAGYKNSHYTPEQLANKEMAYTSTIVWPIRKKLEAEPYDLLGFLCVDSKARNVFENRYDVELGAACADVLYCLLRPILSRGMVRSAQAKPKGNQHESSH